MWKYRTIEKSLFYFKRFSNLVYFNGERLYCREELINWNIELWKESAAFIICEWNRKWYLFLTTGIFEQVTASYLILGVWDVQRCTFPLKNKKSKISITMTCHCCTVDRARKEKLINNIVKTLYIFGIVIRASCQLLAKNSPYGTVIIQGTVYQSNKIKFSHWPYMNSYRFF